MNEVTKAIIARWDAESLDSEIAGGIHNGHKAERTSMPYCLYYEQSAPVIERTRNGVFYLASVQFETWCDDGDPETAADDAELVKAAMENADKAQSDPLVASGQAIMTAQATSEPVTEWQGDQVYRSFFQMEVRVRRTRTLTPA